MNYYKGIGRIIDMFKELIDKQGEIKTDLNRVQVTLVEIKKQNKKYRIFPISLRAII